MKTLFIAGFFQGRDVTLLRTLCENFRVLMFADEYWQRTIQSENLFFIPELADTGLDENYILEMHRYFAFVERTGVELFPDAEIAGVHPDDVANVYDDARAAMRLAASFRQLAASEKIDMVVVSCDLTPARSPIIIEAKRLGIPTFNIEHGYTGSYFRPHVFYENSPVVIPFISDFINLDNILEKQIWEEYYAQVRGDDTMKFVVNGTPSDMSYDRTLTKEQARERLALHKDMFTVCITTTWHDLNNPVNILHSLFEDAEAIKIFFSMLGQVFLGKEFQLIVKIHPAHATANVFNDLREFLHSLAEAHGIRNILVTAEQLESVLASSDLILCSTLSSVLWEGFVAGVPALVYATPDSWYGRHVQKGKSTSGNILFEKGCLRFTSDIKELHDTIAFFTKEENIRQYKKNAAEVLDYLRLSEFTAREKSENICRWIHSFFSDKAPEKITATPVSVDRHHHAAELLKQGELRKALTAYQEIIALEPQNEDALCALGKISHLAGLDQEANTFYSIVLKLNPANEKARAFLSIP